QGSIRGREVLADGKAIDIDPTLRGLWERPLRHLAIFSAGKLPVGFGYAAFVEITLKQSRVLFYRFLNGSGAQLFLTARIEPDRNTGRIDACVEQSRVRPLLPPAREGYIH